MINHARTLLANVRAPVIPSLAGDEFISESYAPIAVSGRLAAVRSVLFGSDPDRLMLNYRIRQLLATVESTDLRDHIIQHDPRVTYDFQDDPFSLPSLYSVSVTSQIGSGGATTTLYPLGTEQAPDANGRMLKEWDVTVDAGTCQSKLRQPAITSNDAYTVTSGLSSIMPFAGSTRSYRVQDSVFTPGAGPKFYVRVVDRPQRDPASLLAVLEKSYSLQLSEIMGFGTERVNLEPWVTYRQVFNSHHAANYKISAVVLAIISEMERLRTL